MAENEIYLECLPCMAKHLAICHEIPTTPPPKMCPEPARGWKQEQNPPQIHGSKSAAVKRWTKNGCEGKWVSGSGGLSWILQAQYHSKLPRLLYNSNDVFRILIFLGFPVDVYWTTSWNWGTEVQGSKIARCFALFTQVCLKMGYPSLSHSLS